MIKTKNIYKIQKGLPPDLRQAIRRAHQQPRTGVTHMNRGPLQQPRTGVRNANRGKTKRIFNICTYNPRTINDLNSHALENLIHEINKVNWDIIGLSETKVKESKIEIHEPTGHKLFFSGNETSRSNGVGFLVNKTCVPLIDSYESISDRLAVLSLRGKFSKFTFIQCYFPTSTHSDEEVLELYDNIQAIVDNIPLRDHLFIMGDFNSKLGKLHNTYPSAIGKHTIGNANSRGELLAHFCTRNQMVATNTRFQKRNLYTWTSPDGNIQNQIDFILTRKPSVRLQLLDSTALNVPDISDHRMVKAKVRISFSWPKKQNANPKYDLKQLKNPVVAQKFKIDIRNRFSCLENITDTEILLKIISKGIQESASKNLSKIKQNQPTWMSDNTKQAIGNKHKIRKEKGPKSTQYKIAKAESKKLVKKDKIKQIQDDIEKLSSLPPHKQYHTALKRLKTKPKNISWGIKDKNGTLLTNKDQILERWANFYEELYADDSNNSPINDSSEDEIPAIRKNEIEAAINTMKDGKSPGLDNICSEYLKAGGESLTKALLFLFNQIITTRKIPQAFKEALIVILYKKNSRFECSNYRPISLLSHIYKVFITIIANRIKNDLYASFPPTQAAYQPGRGAIEQILALEQIIEKSIEFNKPVYICFIDFNKAFDSVKLPCLWKLLESTRINKRYISLLQHTYGNSKAYIKTDIGISRPVSILKGVKQGDVLSAILFCIVIAAILSKTEDECQSGFSIGGHLLSNLSYADDISAVNESCQNLQSFVDSLAKNAAETGLSINVSKTKCMTTDKSNPDLNIKINGKLIEQVSEFTYLGHKLSSKNIGMIAVNQRIGLGWAAFKSNKIALTSKRIPYRLKSIIYKTYVLPVVLYGLECVNWTTAALQKMEVFQNHIMRFMTNTKLTDHVRVENLREITQLPPITAVIKSKVLKLFGHTKRMDRGVSKICLEGMTNGKRNKGQPYKRWRDNIKAWTELDTISLNTFVKDRELWRQLSHVSAHSATSRESD